MIVPASCSSSRRRKELRPARSAGLAQAALVALAWLTLSCGRSSQPGPATAQEPAEVAVQAENHYAGTLVLYLHSAGTSLRLGEVNFQEVKSFVLPWRRLRGDGVFFLRAEVIGSDERVVTDDLLVQPGQVVRWTLTPNLGMSSVAVY